MAHAAVSSGVHAIIDRHLSLNNFLVGLGSALVAEGIVGSGDSMGTEVCRSLTEATVLSLATNGTLQSLASSLMAAGVGASIGRAAAQQGAKQAAALHQGRVFKQGLKDLSVEASTSLEARGILVPAKTIAKQLQQHPVLQGSPEVVEQRLIAIGQAQVSGGTGPSTIPEYLLAGVAWVLGSALDILIPSAHASEFTPEEYRQLQGHAAPGRMPHEAMQPVLPSRVEPSNQQQSIRAQGSQSSLMLSVAPAAVVVMRDPRVLAVAVAYAYFFQRERISQSLMALSHELRALLSSSDPGFDNHLEPISARRPLAMGFMPLFEGRRLGAGTHPFPEHSGLIDQGSLTFPIHAPELERWNSPAPERTLTGTQMLIFPIHQLDTSPQGRPIEQGQGLQFMFRKHVSSTRDRQHVPDRDVRYHKAPEKLTAFPKAVEVKGLTPDGMGGTRAEWHYKGKIYQWDSQHAELEVYDSRGKKHFGSVDHITGAKRGDPKPGRNIRKYVN